MAISLKHAFTSNVADSGDTTLVQPSNWNAEHTLTAAANTLLGAVTSGPVTEITCTAAGRAILDDADAAAQRTTLGAAASGAITSSGLTQATSRILGRTTASSGAIEEISIGTGLTLATGSLSVTANTYQPLDADLTAIAALSNADNNFIVGNGTTWVAESGATARTSLGLGTGDSPQFTGLTLTGVGQFSAGSNTAPSIAPSGDLNTGIWFPAADTIAFTEGGVESMRIDSAGFLGVGTSTIPAQVSVVGTGQAVSTTFDTAGNLGGSLLLGDIGGAGQNGGAIVFSANSTAWRFAAIKGNVTNGSSNTQGDLSFYVRNAAADANLTRAMVISSAGTLGIGGSATAGFTVTANRNITGSVSGGGFLSNGVIQSDATSIPTYFSAILNTVAGSYTVSNPQLFRAVGGSIGAGSSITNLFGYVAAALTAGTNNFNFTSTLVAADVTTGKTAYGFYEGSNTATGGGVTWAFYGAGTANSFFGGNVGIGSTSLTGVSLFVSRSITGSVNSVGITSQGVIQSDVTNTAAYYRSFAFTAAASFTLANMFHYYAGQQSIGVGSTVTSQHGFFSETNLIGATNNYAFFASNTAGVTAGRTAFGFYSAINIATGGGTTWAFYGAGTAPSYFAGNIGVNTLTPDARLSVNGVASFGAGAVGAPSVAAFGDLNTGMWFPAADTIAFSTGGAEEMRITSGGNIGIGTTSPSTLLTVSATNANGIDIAADGGAGTASGRLFFSTSTAGQAACIRTVSGGILTFATSATVGTNSGTERARIDTSGNFAIGTTDLTSGSRLVINNTPSASATSIALLSGGTFNGEMGLGVLTGFGDGVGLNARQASGTIVFGTNNTERVRVTSAGRVGIGTTTPACSLDVVGGIQTSRTTVTAPAATDGNVFSGTYTPTLTNVTNVAASTAYLCQYMRVGNTVTVSGRVAIDPTNINTPTELRMSLPIAATFGATTRCGGTFARGGTGIGNSGSVSANTANNEAFFAISPSGSANEDYWFSFTYTLGV